MNEKDPTEYNIPNTFAPRCKSQILSVNQIIAGLRASLLLAFDNAIM